MSCTGLIVAMGSFQLSQFNVNTHYLALRTTVKKLVVLTAFLFATITANQAIACDMGAIETWGCHGLPTERLRDKINY
jgi:hypothetical protein